jgi:hypothetical protein
MPSVLPDILPIVILAAGFVTGFYVRHRISEKRKKNARHAFFKHI